MFFDAIIPVTLYLPSITPLEESLEILPLAYEALFALYDVQYTSQAPTPETKKARLNYLTSILRRSIFAAHLHVSTHTPITSLLILQLQILIPKLGIHTAKHLKDIFPLLSSVLTDPFAGARLDDVLGALSTLRVLILACWARVREEEWRGEVVRELVLCWGVLEELSEGDEGMVRKCRGEIKVVGRVFAKSVEGAVDLRVELRPLLDVDEGIGEVFGFEDVQT